MTDTATPDVDHDVDAPADPADPGPAASAEPATTADAAPTTRRRPGRGQRRRRGGGVSSATRVRAASAVLWVLVAAGPLTGGAALALHADAGADTSPAIAPAGAPSSTAVEGFAERYVATFLGQAGDGAEDTLAPFYAGTAELGEVEAGSVWVARTVPVAADQIGEGYWEVTVAAEVLTADGETYTPAGWRYYAVGVVATDDGQAATGLPSQVSAPPRLDDAPDRAVAGLSAPGDEPQVEAAAGFLRAYLAGDGELARYTAPDTALTRIAEPYQSVEVTQAGLAELAADRVLVRTQVSATDAAGLTHASGYSLELVSRDGRWEVTALHGAPPLEPHLESRMERSTP